MVSHRPPPTCVQCLAHTGPLLEVFASGAYRDDINRDNPLGMGGKLADAFGALMDKLWRGNVGSVTPRAFKAELARFAPQFGGYAQQDSQELLAFLLDGLHEDLNRIKQKPYVEVGHETWRHVKTEGAGAAPGSCLCAFCCIKNSFHCIRQKGLWPITARCTGRSCLQEKDSDGRPDKVVADEAWSNYRLRNDSVIVDHFQVRVCEFAMPHICPDLQLLSDLNRLL